MFMHPVPGPITSPYGPRGGGFHNGIDYGWLLADPINSRNVYAPASGTVTVGWNALVGNFLELPTDIGLLRLAHFDSIAVKSGEQVVQGRTFLGVMGATGAQVNGVHLHVDLYMKDGRVDPAPHFTIPFGQVPEKPKARKRNMTTRFVQIGTGGSNFGVGAICALAGDAGFPGPGNWQEYTRTVADGGVNDRAAREAAVHGPAIPISKEQWAALRASYTEGAVAGSGGGFTSADRARLQAVPTADQNGAAARAAIVKP